MVDNKILINVLNQIMGVWGLCLILSSVVFNFLVCFVCLRSRQLRSTTTFKFLAIAAINDMLLCFPWDLDDFTSVFFEYPIYLRNLFYCNYIEIFLQYSTINFSSWLFVSISLDRVLSLSVKKWSSQYFTAHRPVVYVVMLALAIVSMHVVSIFGTGYSYRNENGTYVVVCFEDSHNSSAVFDFINLVKYYLN